MIENYAWLAILLFNHTVDFVIIYLMAHKFGGNKFEGKWQHFALILLFGIIMGAFMYFGIISSVLGRLFMTLLTFIIMKIVTKRKLLDIVLIYAPTFLLLVAIQLVVLSFLVGQTSEEISFLLTQTTVLIIFVLIYWKVPLYEMLLFTKQRLVLILGIILLYATTNTLLLISEFDIYNAFEYMFQFGLVIIITFWALFSVLIMAQTKIDRSSDEYHDLVNKFAGFHLAIEASETPEEIKILSRDLKQYITGRETIEALTENHEENITKILQEKLMDSGKTNELVLDLGYYEHHMQIDLGTIVYMIGALFDNALEHGLDKPIFVSLNVYADNFELEMRNSCNEISDRKMAKLFKKGFSTKEQLGRGQGLYKLKTEVSTYNKQWTKAEIKADSYYDFEHKCNYLEIKIEVSIKKNT